MESRAVADLPMRARATLQPWGFPIVTGRGFTAMDTTEAPHVLIVNQAFVQKYFGKTQPLGRLVQVMPEPQYPARTYEVAGTIPDTKYNGLRAIA